MKLIEKLARENVGHLVDRVDSAKYAGFIAGFRAARELLVEKAKEGWTEYRFNPDQNKHVPGPKHIGTVCQSDIEQLGEEEV